MRSSFLPADARETFRDVTAHWWVAGGWAIDLYLGRQTRVHEDLDIAAMTVGQDELWRALEGWDLWLGEGDGPVRPWSNQLQVIPDADTPVWCRFAPDDAWAFEVLLSPGDEDNWEFKRTPAVTRPRARIGSKTSDGIPYLRPEVVLLFKAKGLREHDREDFESVRKSLDMEARAWLAESLRVVHPGHEWIAALE